MSLSADVCRCYRLLDAQGLPHGEIDDLFDSVEAAWEAAHGWCEAHGLLGETPGSIQAHAVVGSFFGIEVNTRRGDWRTLRHAVAGPLSQA